MNYTKKEINDTVAIIENTNYNTFIVTFNLLILQIFNIFFLSASFYFYINYT